MRKRVINNNDNDVNDYKGAHVVIVEQGKAPQG
jgi:hypothetical protein